MTFHVLEFPAENGIELKFIYFYFYLVFLFSVLYFSQPSFKKVRHFGYREDPFIFLKQDDQIWEPIL